MDILDRIFKRVYKEPDGGCWLWLGSKNSNGYGKISKDNKDYYVHRIVYEKIHGEILKGNSVMHSCDVRNCCNPNHLTQGTTKDNAIDRDSKDRTGFTVFTHEQVREYRESGVSPSVLSKQTGIPYVTCWQMLTGRTYKIVK